MAQEVEVHLITGRGPVQNAAPFILDVVTLLSVAITSPVRLPHGSFSDIVAYHCHPMNVCLND